MKYLPVYGYGDVQAMQCDKSDNDMSRVVRKPAFCICENKDADQLRGNREVTAKLISAFVFAT